MYVIETAPGHGAATLLDISAKELRETRAKWSADGWTYREVSAPYAHKWVKDGAIHSTDLWVDDRGRIRRAGIGC